MVLPPCLADDHCRNPLPFAGNWKGGRTLWMFLKMPIESFERRTDEERGEVEKWKKTGPHTLFICCIELVRFTWITPVWFVSLSPAPLQSFKAQPQPFYFLHPPPCDWTHCFFFIFYHLFMHFVSILLLFLMISYLVFLYLVIIHAYSYLFLYFYVIYFIA